MGLRSFLGAGLVINCMVRGVCRSLANMRLSVLRLLTEFNGVRIYTNTPRPCNTCHFLSSARRVESAPFVLAVERRVRRSKTASIVLFAAALFTSTLFRSFICI